MGNLKSGTDFEARIASLLECSTGYRNVRQQQHICGKNVDIVFQKQWNPHRQLRIAVECKNWKSGLDRDAVREIYFDHKPLFDKHEIDELWIVTPNPVAPSVQEFADAFKGLEILHVAELEQDVIDFTLYLGYLKSLFAKQKLSSYYVEARIEGEYSGALHRKIRNWLASPTAMPIAIWGGYGMGKTSYARFLASELADEYLNDRSNRIPILVPLGDYYTAPRLDGLFANVLTGDYGVHAYNFHTFWNLHQAGRFVIILDGFDEMKHAMTEAEFYVITDEIRSLITERAKVVLLGRPDTIISDEEHSFLIKGKRKEARIEVQDYPKAEFTEYRLDYFTQDEFQEFIERYIHAFYSGDDHSDFLQRRLREVREKNIEDLIKRPVQARMLAQIILNPENAIGNLSKYDLYNYFISDCLNAENLKQARRRLTSAVRRDFMRRLAWWLWAIKRTRTFTPRDIPQSLIQEFCGPDPDLGELRELLVGSVIEEEGIGSILSEKRAGTFYFPHLSFTEFLVSEYVVDKKLTEDDIKIVAASLDGEIKEFVESCTTCDAFLKLYSDLDDYKRSLPWNFVDCLASAGGVQKYSLRFVEASASLEELNRTSRWQFAIQIVALMKSGHEKSAIAKSVELLGREDVQYYALSAQILLKLALVLIPWRQKLCELLLIELMKKIRFIKLFYEGKWQNSYATNTDTEEFAVGLISEVSFWAPSQRFHFDLARLYRRAKSVPETLLDESSYEVCQVTISADELNPVAPLPGEIGPPFDGFAFHKWVRELTLSGGGHSVLPAISRAAAGPVLGKPG